MKAQEADFERNKAILSVLPAMASGPVFMRGQPPAPPPVGLALTTVSGGISQFNYGPEGCLEGFVVAPPTLVLLPPHWAGEV